jgi:hypothetical protein
MLWAGDRARGVYTINPDTGTVTKVLSLPATTGISSAINDLAFDSRSGLMYRISGGALFNEPNTLFTIDLKSPSLTVNLLGTVIPPHPSAASISGLTFDDIGTLYAVESYELDNRLFTIDPGTLAVGRVYDLPSPAHYNIADLARSRHSGRITAVKALPYELFEIDVPGGRISSHHTGSSISYVYGLAYAADRDRRYVSYMNTSDYSGVVCEIGRDSAGVVRVICGHTRVFSGLEYCIPEPGISVLWTTACLAMCGVVWRNKAARRNE